MSKFALIFIFMYLCGVILALAQGAHWGFYIYELVYYLNPTSRWWSDSIPALPYSLISVALIFVLYVLSNKKYSNNLISEVPYIKSIVFLIISYILVYFYAINPDLHLQATVDFIKLLFVMSIAYKILDNRKKLEGALIAYLAGAAYIGYETYLVGRDSTGRVENIGMIDAPDANGTAAALVPALPLLIFYFWKGTLKQKIFSFAAGGLIVNALVLINSRGAFLGGAVACTYLMWEMFKAKIKATSRQRLSVILLAIVGLLAVASVVDDSFMDRMDTLSSIEDEEKSGSHRYRFWIIAVEMSAEYPFGIGAYGYELLSPVYVPPELMDREGKLKAVHSMWFQALSEIGWHGLTFFLLIIFIVASLPKKIKKKCLEDNDSYTYYLAHALLTSYIGLLIASTFINQFRVQMIYWVILFITCLYSIVIMQKSEKA